LHCTCSKYEQVTPPALAKKSGIKKIFFSLMIASASGVVGPFAASHNIFTLL